MVQGSSLVYISCQSGQRTWFFSECHTRTGFGSYGHLCLSRQAIPCGTRRTADSLWHWVQTSPDTGALEVTALQWSYWCRLKRLNYKKKKKLSLLLHLKLFPGVQNSKFSFHLTPLYVATNEISRLEALCLSQQGKMFLEQGHFENRSYSNKKPLRNREINTCDIGAGWQSFTVLFQQNRQGQVHRRFTVENYLDEQTEAVQNKQ